jgi:hypothetical protein
MRMRFDQDFVFAVLRHLKVIVFARQVRVATVDECGVDGLQWDVFQPYLAGFDRGPLPLTDRIKCPDFPVLSVESCFSTSIELP